MTEKPSYEELERRVKDFERAQRLHLENMLRIAHTTQKHALYPSAGLDALADSENRNALISPIMLIRI